MKKAVYLRHMSGIPRIVRRKQVLRMQPVQHALFLALAIFFLAQIRWLINQPGLRIDPARLSRICHTR